MKESGITRFCLVSLAFLSIFVTGCERDINFDLKEEAPKLVVEATIENGQPPVVILTNSLNYFSTVSPAQLAQSFVRNADVFISNGSTTHKLKEYTIPLGGGFFLAYYSVDSSNLSTAFPGEIKKSYSLRIVAAGEDYTAVTTIPDTTRRIDSVWYKAGPPQLDSNKVIVMLRATDPPGFGDYIRYFTKRNSERFLPGLNSAYDDLFIDGTTYELQVGAGVDRNSSIKEEDLFFNRGDTVTIQVSNIDKATFDFWQTLEYSYRAIGNPFSTPIKVTSNIRGNALGYFGGYASKFRTIIIPK